MGKRPKKPTSIFSAGPAALREWLGSIGEEPYRARQILQWAYRRGIGSFEEMTDISRSLQRSLKARFLLRTMTVAHKAKSKKGDASKLLLQLFFLPLLGESTRSDDQYLLDDAPKQEFLD